MELGSTHISQFRQSRDYGHWLNNGCITFLPRDYKILLEFSFDRHQMNFNDDETLFLIEECC